MKKHRSILSLLLTAAFLFSSLPALACDTSCSPTHGSMSCAMRCALADGMAAHDAKGTPSMRSNCCGGASGSEAAPTVLAPSAQVKVVAAESADLQVISVPTTAPDLAVRIVSTRVAPAAHLYLWSQHPFANAPPSSI